MIFSSCILALSLSSPLSLSRSALARRCVAAAQRVDLGEYGSKSGWMYMGGWGESNREIVSCRACVRALCLPSEIVGNLSVFFEFVFQGRGLPNGGHGLGCFSQVVFFGGSRFVGQPSEAFVSPSITKGMFGGLARSNRVSFVGRFRNTVVGLSGCLCVCGCRLVVFACGAGCVCLLLSAGLVEWCGPSLLFLRHTES